MLSLDIQKSKSFAKDFQKKHIKSLKDARDKVIDLQDKVVEVLKEKYQEEIDATKDKYNALEEADNDYLDALEEAIEKQRKLRDRENSYEDLAQKERKLALLKRDTSGTNQKDVLSLEDEVQQDREKLLDDEVDSLIDSMKEMYETQKEARDAEIEYLEDVLDAADLYKEADLIFKVQHIITPFG